MDRDVIEKVPALDGAHSAFQRPVGEQHALPARKLEDESFENLGPGSGVHELHYNEGENFPMDGDPP